MNGQPLQVAMLHGRTPDGSRVVGGALLVAAAALFVLAWARILTGSHVLIGVDILYGVPPWQGQPAAHQPLNAAVSDPVLQFLPWQELVSTAYQEGRLPLWNPDALSGKPLLANDQSAPFSPFTLVALPFGPAHGLSLAMLARLWVAGVGMALFLRLLGARSPAMVAGGVGYACSSFMVVWLAWPHAGVAAIMPWAFAAAEWYLSGGGRLAQVALAVTVALQLLAGHAETSLHLGFGLTLYCVVRWLLGARGWRPLAGLAVAAGLGLLLSAAGVLPFVQELQRSTLVGDRAISGAGSYHLDPGALLSWVVPNAHGNPAIDGRVGLPPNYNESTGFAGVALLMLAPIGTVWQLARQPSRAAALTVLGLAAAGIVYGPLTGVAGRLPGLSVAANTRMTVLLCFVVSAFGGLGVQAVWEARSGLRDRPPLGRAAAAVGLAAGALASAALAGAAARVLVAGAPGAALPAPLPAGYRAFWGGLAVLALVASAAFVVGGLIGGRGRPAAGGLAVVVLLEACLFAVPFQPQVPANEVPPSSQVTDWLQQEAGSSPIAAVDVILPPDSATLYGLHDVRAYDIVRGTRSRTYWAAADSGYHDEAASSLLKEPGAGWLARAGVHYVLTAQGAARPGTTPVFDADGVTIAEVPGPRAFASLSASWSSSSGASETRDLLAADPRRAPVVEGAQPSPAAAAASDPAGTAQVRSRRPESFQIDVDARGERLLTVLQSYSPDWRASVDGRGAQLYAVDVLFQGIIVPAGHHRIAFSYQPATVVLGLALSGAGVVSVVVLLLTAALPRVVSERARSRLRAGWRRGGPEEGANRL